MQIAMAMARAKTTGRSTATIQLQGTAPLVYAVLPCLQVFGKPASKELALLLAEDLGPQAHCHGGLGLWRVRGAISSILVTLTTSPTQDVPPARLHAAAKW